MPLLPVLYQSQRSESDCLAACASMVLDYLEIPHRYERLLSLLKVRSYGTSFSNLRFLERLGVDVQVLYGNDIQELKACLDIGLPPIVFLDTGFLMYWPDRTSHAVVVIGIDSEANTVTVHDPYINEPAKEINLISFEAAWISRSMQYAVVSLE